MDEKMVHSQCCKEKVYSYSIDDGVMVNMCYRCNNECDTICLIEHDERNSHDTGIEAAA